MSKLRLRLDELAVESFDTSAARAERGTVVGQQLCTCQTACTCPGCPTCANYATCDPTCPETCDDYSCAVSCGGTCHSCDGTCRPIDCPATFDCW
jgi:hypothetical protein